MTDIAKEVIAIMNEISERITADIQPNEFTTTMYAAQAGIPYERAENHLKRQEKSGLLVSRKAYDPGSGRIVRAYKKVEE